MAIQEEMPTQTTTSNQTVPRQISRETFMAGSFSRPGSRHGSTMQLNKETPMKLQDELEEVKTQIPAKPIPPIPHQANPIKTALVSGPLTKLEDKPIVGEEMHPKVTTNEPSKLPDYLIILTVYSLVILGILLISNVTPNGKLYIHFTAFWSMIIYFILDDNLDNDILETVVRGMATKRTVAH